MRRVPMEKICHNNRRATGDGSTKVRLSVGAKVVAMMNLYLNHAAPVHACGQEYEPGLIVSHKGFSAVTASLATPGAHSRRTSSRDHFIRRTNSAEVAPPS